MNDFINQFESSEWSEIKNLADRKHLKITKNSTLLSKKIYEQIGFLVYPVIFRTYAGHRLLSSGAFSWTMYQKNGKEIGSIETVKTCLRKDKILVISTTWKDFEIFAEDVAICE